MNNDLFYLIDTFEDLKVLIIGEAMLDSYFSGASSRLSREAPVPVVEIDCREDVPGGAANTAENVRSLGATPIFISVVGDDVEGKLLLQALEDSCVCTETILAHPERKTLAKQRVIAGDQMLVRFDQGTTTMLDAETERQVIGLLRDYYPKVDGVILSDYGYGIFTPRIVKEISRLQAKYPHILIGDSKNLEKFRSLGVTAVKPNYGEVCQLLKLQATENKATRLEWMVNYSEQILEMTGAQIAAVTMDSDGALIFERGRAPYRTYAQPMPHTKATGAGDTFVAALALALAGGAETPAAAEIASAAAAIVVQKTGTSTCATEELKGYFTGVEKVVSDAFQLVARIAAYRKQGKRIVFTNGCFDILHRGHVTYLNQAKALGDVLIIGLNSDDSVRRLKGPKRPINTLEDRSQVLAALSCIDHIVPFDEDTPADLIKVICPDIFVKGGDYTKETLPEAELVASLGGEIQLLPYVEDRSTTKVIERIQQSEKFEKLG